MVRHDCIWMHGGIIEELFDLSHCGLYRICLLNCTGVKHYEYGGIYCLCIVQESASDFLYKCFVCFAKEWRGVFIHCILLISSINRLDVGVRLILGLFLALSCGYA